MATTTTAKGAAPDQPGDGVDISAPRARQGYRGRRVLWMLLASLALVIVAFVIAFTANPTTPVSGQAGGGATKDPVAARSFDAPSPETKPPG